MFDERRMAVTGAHGCDIMSVSEESVPACSTNGEWRSQAPAAVT